MYSCRGFPPIRRFFAAEALSLQIFGWEVLDTWRRHCYWGPSGCKEELPEGQIITCLLTLCSFWIDTPSMSIALVIFNVLLQGLFGWDLIRELPPGSGSVPKIGPSTVISLSPVPPTVSPSLMPSSDDSDAKMTKTSQSLYMLRRIIFCVYFLTYLIAVPVCLL
ncbi:hypothetical protein Q1695_002506 [Nippostrongylus brasiliensis]|nr:hypothetical protein Q1695_002506 [Nippostrongylus brasiliensis]